MRYDNRRTVLTLGGLVRLRLKIQWCENRQGLCHHCPIRPEASRSLIVDLF